MKQTISILLAFFTCVAVFAGEPAYVSSYTGQEARQIKSLSPGDIEQLKAGKGWGLAKAAELNGMPGPAHVLQMKKEIKLTAEQLKKIQALYDEMKSNAIPLGRKLVELEKELNDAFASRTITEKSLRKKLDEIANISSQLRYVHLVTHLQTPAILTPDQVALYNRLRGYGKGDPCNNIPAGHDAVMWKKHNGCS